jgi:hypothetical protein
MNKKIGWIGRGTYYKEIHKHLKQHGVDSLLLNDRPRFAQTRDIIVNYGLTGEKQLDWAVRANTWRTDRREITLNNSIFGNKLQCCEQVRAVGVPVPECRASRITSNAELPGFIVKPLLSFGGRGIVPYTGQAVTSRQYLQKRITNRRYELRVHGVKWLPVEEWLVSKRTHPDGEAQLTWNHHQGGSFSNIEMNESNTGVFKRAKQYAKKAIQTLGYDFAAVDFIVQNGSGELPVWFIEANLAPGFTTDRTREFYCNAFLKLADTHFYDEDLSITLATSIPPPVPVQETPVPTAPRSLNLTHKLLIIERISSQSTISPAQLIEFINNLR